MTEYLIGRLGEECGLPIAPVSIVEIPSELTRYAVVERADEFCPGFAFASQRIPLADDLRISHIRQIPEEMKMRCLLFDWWTRNPDRRLDILGGDPNTLWDPAEQTIALIDHDRCLDPDFDPVEFRREHVFRDSRPFLEVGLFERARTKFESAIYNLGEIWDEMPEEWLVDKTGTARISFTQQDVESRLIKPEFAADDLLPGK